jgi:hypothetical protein
MEVKETVVLRNNKACSEIQRQLTKIAGIASGHFVINPKNKNLNPGKTKS